MWGSSQSTYISSAKAQVDNLQFRLGDSVSVYSEKAYRKNQGKVFEAIGNVVILSGDQTLYGEKARINSELGEIKVEGNVRAISQSITIYGSSLTYTVKNQKMNVLNVRAMTDEFSLVADSLEKKENGIYHAKSAEFTTCKDCTESWTLYGSTIDIEVGQYVTIRDANIKVKGVDIAYFPYIALPIKNKRESGLLFPLFLSRANEGLSYLQPIYWAIDEHKDATVSPSFWGKRGYGSDLEYRQVFGESNWLEYSHRLVEDKIYLPGKLADSESGTSYFRHLYKLEYHGQFGHDVTSHFKAVDSRDLDMFRDYTDYTDNFLEKSSIGLEGFVEKRYSNFNIGVESQFRRNLLISDPEDFDDSYVQVLPSVYFNYGPRTLYQSDTLFLNNITTGLNSNFTRFAQNKRIESENLRNANRVNFEPYLLWHFFSRGPVSLSSEYTFSLQNYEFTAGEEDSFQKSAGLLKTELSFSIDKVFGLAYKEKFSKTQRGAQLQESSESQKNSGNSLIGGINSFEDSLIDKERVIVKNSYRHSQEFKFIHHYIAHQGERGNSRFRDQIRSAQGWFDYQDAVMEDQADLGSNSTRTLIPRENTIEFQWNNLLIKKSPKEFNYFEDDRYLRDNFSYAQIGHFKVSQGVELGTDENIEERLTRLHINTGINGKKWSLNLSQFYFHQNQRENLSLNITRNIYPFNFLASYNSNTLPGANIKTLRLGGQVKIQDTFGISYLSDEDLDAGESILNIFQLDIMPQNNCWIFNINYRESVVDQRYSFNIIFNLGNEDYRTYKDNFFDFQRVVNVQ